MPFVLMCYRSILRIIDLFEALFSQAFRFQSVHIQEWQIRWQPVTCLNVMRSTCLIWRWPKQLGKLLHFLPPFSPVFLSSTKPDSLEKVKQKALYMVDAKHFMAAERNGHNGQIFEALRNRFPEIPEQVISLTLQSEVKPFDGWFLVSFSQALWGILTCYLFIDSFQKIYLRIWL